MSKTLPLLGVFLCASLLGACNSSAPGKAGASPAAASNVKVANTETRDGTQKHVVLKSKVDGTDVSFELYEPDHLVAGETYPLILHGHGYGGSRQTTRTGFLARMTAAGYYVISIDQRGFGASGGTVRSMDPEFDGLDLVQMLDWAEDLPGLRRRADGSMLVGSYGGSYGGMYQMLLAAVDPQHRLRVLAPDITPHDLVYALDPHNVVKSGWGLALSAAGDVTSNASQANFTADMTRVQNGKPTRQDPVIYETLVQASIRNAFADAGKNMFTYHSVKYFCDGEPAGPQNFTVGTPDKLSIPPTPYPAIDVMFTQGFRDTLFNFNDGLGNYECLKARGGDVRLLTHQSGHILAVGPAGGGGLVPTPLPNVEGPLDPFYQAVNFPGFQDPGSSRNCGKIVLDDAQFAWFEEKLQKRGKADDVIKTGSDFCLSLAEGDAIETKSVKVGGLPFPLNLSTPQFNAVLGVGGALLGNGEREALLETVPLYTVPAGGQVIAGIPTLDLKLDGLSGQELSQCPTPVGVAGCDPILFLALGVQHKGQQRFDLIDDQVTALRGFGAHTERMNGIAERLLEGDSVALLIYGFHAQFPVTWSRDLLVPALKISGSVALPLLGPEDIVKDGV